MSGRHHAEARFSLDPHRYLVPHYILFDIAREKKDTDLRDWLLSPEFDQSIETLIPIIRKYQDELKNFILYN
jgi:hypothetical protein